MEEEAEKSRDARLEAWGRDDYSVYKPKTVTKPSEVAVEVQVIWFLFLDIFDVIDKIVALLLGIYDITKFVGRDGERSH